jgi:hypoxanthine phosphoribosyltransferase
VKEDISDIVVSKEEIHNMVQHLADRVSEDYKGKDLVMIGILKGGFVFLADLVRAMKIPAGIDFISVSSYGSSTDSSGIVKISKDVDIDVKDRHVLFVEDIVDTGLTLKHLKELFKTREPQSIKICSAFDKPSRRAVDVEIEYMGIQVPDCFLVGYGLDYNEKYRTLPYLCNLKIDVTD